MGGFVGGIIVVAVTCGFIAFAIANSRMGGHGAGAYFFIGLLLGVIGVIIACFAPRRVPNPTCAPGWYPDPSTPGTQRWYDGQSWTQHTHTG